MDFHAGAVAPCTTPTRSASTGWSTGCAISPAAAAAPSGRRRARCCHSRPVAGHSPTGIGIAPAELRRGAGGWVRKQVGIIGAGPAGLFLALRLHQAGLDVLVLELRSREYVEGPVRAGVLEQTTVRHMHELGIGARVAREGLQHSGTNLCVDGEPLHLDFSTLTSGAVTIYGQSEVMKDLHAAADQRGIEIVYGAVDVMPRVDSTRASISWSSAGSTHEAHCDFVVGCDGYHGVSRSCIPADRCTTFERIYPFGWLGILADVPPCNEELIYANHPNGFALASMRSPTRRRCYLQCSLEAHLEEWSDSRFWDEVGLRL